MAKEKISITVDERILREVDHLIDHITVRNRSQAFEFLVRQSLGGTRTAVILAGGEPKAIRIGGYYRPTVSIRGKTVVERAVAKLRASGFSRIIVVARKQVLTQIFEVIRDGSSIGVAVDYVEERESRGTAQSLRLIKGHVGADFLVVYGDLLFEEVNLEALWEEHLRRKPIATLMLTTSSRPAEKGTVRVEGSKVLSFEQRPAESDIYLVFSPIFAASEQLLDVAGASLETEVFPRLSKQGTLEGYLSSEKERHVHSDADMK